jgi:hypothetical protein
MFMYCVSVANMSGRALDFLFLTEKEGYHTCADCSTNRSLSCLWVHLPSTMIKQPEEEKSEHQHKELDRMLHLHGKWPVAAESVARKAHLAKHIT